MRIYGKPKVWLIRKKEKGFFPKDRRTPLDDGYAKIPGIFASALPANKVSMA
jgi:hypothetical protein